MKIYIFLVLLLSPFILSSQQYKEMINAGTFTVKEIQAAAESYFQYKDKGRGSGYKQWKRWEYRAERMVTPEGYLQPAEHYYNEIKRYNNNLNQHLLTAKGDDCVGDWTELGPIDLRVTEGYNPGLGRITSIGVDETDAEHFIIGSHSGGVWRTEDGGDNWTVLTDEFSNMDVFSLAIAPSNSDVYYWGGLQGIVFRTDDRGSTWEKVTTAGVDFITYIKVDPNDYNKLWISSFSGLYYSADGGQTWDHPLNAYIYDIEVHPTDSATIYAAGNRFWVSNDHGATFSQSIIPGDFGGVKMLSVTPSAPDNVYMIGEIGAALDGFYKSTDKGTTFNEIDVGGLNLLGYSDTGSDNLGQAPRDMDIIVSPTDSNLIFIAGINLWRTTDGGANFELVSHWYFPYGDNLNVGYTHADIDILVINQEELLIGSDGGIYCMEDMTAPISKEVIEDLSNGLGISQFYKLGIAQIEEEVVATGAQDNGSSVYIEGEWRNYYGADGGETVIIGDDPNIIVGSVQFGGILGSSRGLTSYELNATGIRDLIGEGRFIAPIERSAGANSSIYSGFDRVYKSDDQANTYEPISQSFNGKKDALSIIKVAPSDPHTIYACIDRSLIFRTQDGGATAWTRVFHIGTVNAFSINEIAVHPLDPNLIAVAFSGYKTRVLISRDGGESWEDWSEGLPDFSVGALAWQSDDTESLYAGLNYGIFNRDKNNPTWLPFMLGLPNVEISELEINHVTNKIYAATFGRGLWVSPTCLALVDNKEVYTEDEFIVHPNPITSTGRITITLPDQIQGELRIFNSSGQIVYRAVNQLFNNNDQLDWQPRSTGIYYIRLTTNQGNSVRKVIVH